MSGPTVSTLSPALVSHCVTWATWAAVGANCAWNWSSEMNWPNCELDGSLTACASASSCAAFRGASHTFAWTSSADGTTAVCGTDAVHDGRVPCMT